MKILNDKIGVQSVWDMADEIHAKLNNRVDMIRYGYLDNQHFTPLLTQLWNPLYIQLRSDLNENA